MADALDTAKHPKAESYKLVKGIRSLSLASSEDGSEKDDEDAKMKL